ncbi:MAG: ABC transporter ATP-binding protein [Terracidiphilus sp.]|jgi:putative ABC transport system ATP-binding protein
MSQEVKVDQPLIRLRDVCKGWYAGGTRIEVLHHINLDIPLGSSTAIQGPSGSGKSTLVHILALLTPIDSGDYSFRGIPVSREGRWWDSTIRQDIGIVFQDGKLIHNLTALKNVCVPLAHRGVWPDLQKEMACNALEQVGLSHRINSFPNQLSGGETIRCAIARALVTNPILVLADEPTGTLDSKTGEMISDLLFGLVQAHRSLVMVSHDSVLAERADRIVHIKDGLLNAC